MNLDRKEYTKQQLAEMLFPDRTQKAASMQLYKDMRRCTDLMEALRRTGYRTHCHVLRHHQVRLIMEYLYPDM